MSSLSIGFWQETHTQTHTQYMSASKFKRASLAWAFVLVCEALLALMSDGCQMNCGAFGIQSPVYISAFQRRLRRASPVWAVGLLLGSVEEELELAL